MQDQRIEGSTWLPDPDEVARVILDLLLERYPALVAVDELVRELAEPSLLQRIERFAIEDGLVDLVTSGLIHRLDRFVFASRAAERSSTLAVEPR